VRDRADVDESPTDAADRAERAEERTEQAEERTGQAEERAEEAAADAEESEAGAEQAEQGARTAEHGSREAEHVDRLIEKFDDEGDPLLDTTMHEIVAEVDEQHPFGVPGAPMNFHTPFWIAVRATFGVLLVLLAAESVLKARNVLVLIAVSAFLAIGLNPMVEWLQRHGIGRRASVALISLGFLLFFAGAGRSPTRAPSWPTGCRPRRSTCGTPTRRSVTWTSGSSWSTRSMLRPTTATSSPR
jgi:hypothetical protein